LATGAGAEADTAWGIGLSVRRGASFFSSGLEPHPEKRNADKNRLIKRVLEGLYIIYLNSLYYIMLQYNKIL
jgi:hypothetical protein